MLKIRDRINMILSATGSRKLVDQFVGTSDQNARESKYFRPLVAHANSEYLGCGDYQFSGLFWQSRA